MSFFTECQVEGSDDVEDSRVSRDGSEVLILAPQTRGCSFSLHRILRSCHPDFNLFSSLIFKSIFNTRIFYQGTRLLALDDTNLVFDCCQILGYIKCMVSKQLLSELRKTIPLPLIYRTSKGRPLYHAAKALNLGRIPPKRWLTQVAFSTRAPQEWYAIENSRPGSNAIYSRPNYGP